MAERITIGSGGLTAAIDPFGAELQSLRDPQGRELMWRGDPAFWSGRAPLLFPIVGRLNGDEARIDGRRYALPKHGFARQSLFALAEHSADRARFRLTDSAQTRALYPFAFTLDAEFRVAEATLAMTVTVGNPGDVPLPASFGYHPAFVWPLPFGGRRTDHVIAFERDEPADLCAITPDGLIGTARTPTPVSGKTLALADALFAADALVWDTLASRRLRYGVPGQTMLDIAFPDTAWLGVWTKPGAGFVCIEPWAGMADPHGYAGAFRDKPGIRTIAPQGAAWFRMTVTVLA